MHEKKKGIYYKKVEKNRLTMKSLERKRPLRTLNIIKLMFHTINLWSTFPCFYFYNIVLLLCKEKKTVYYLYDHSYEIFLSQNAHV